MENSSEPEVFAETPTPAAPATRWWLYLLACTDGRTYAGIAIDPAARFSQHLAGKGAKFTRANKPLKILGAQPFADKGTVLRAEYSLKQLTPDEKLHWAQCWPFQIKETSGSERPAPVRQPRQSRPRTGSAR